MPDHTSDSIPPDFQLFEERSFFGLEGVLRPAHLPLLGGCMQVAVALLIVWAPLLVLATVQGMAIGPTRAESFLYDAGVQARLLIALPLILVFPRIISLELRAIVEHFVKARLIPSVQQERFAGYIASTMKLSRSRLAESVILVLIYTIHVLLILFATSKTAPSWRVLGEEGHRVPSLAGWWLAAVSEPIYEFVLFRFLYRIAVWWRLLWKTSRLDLQLDGAHPDRAGGIGFLGMTLYIFKEVAFAISTSFAGGLANIVLRTGVPVSRYKFEIPALVVLTMGLFAGPLFFFYRTIVRTRDRDTLAYWVLWQGQRRQFHPKWMGDVAEYPDMLSVQDFSEATDLSQLLERVQQMRIVPFRGVQILPLLLAASLPFLAVMTIDVPVEQMIQRLLKIVF